jgi:hypothetical protein
VIDWPFRHRSIEQMQARECTRFQAQRKKQSSEKKRRHAVCGPFQLPVTWHKMRSRVHRAPRNLYRFARVSLHLLRATQIGAIRGHGRWLGIHPIPLTRAEPPMMHAPHVQLSRLSSTRLDHDSVRYLQLRAPGRVLEHH